MGAHRKKHRDCENDRDKENQVTTEICEQGRQADAEMVQHGNGAIAGRSVTTAPLATSTNGESETKGLS